MYWAESRWAEFRWAESRVGGIPCWAESRWAESSGRNPVGGIPCGRNPVYTTRKAPDEKIFFAQYYVIT